MNLRITKMKPPVKRDDLVFPELSYQLVSYAYQLFDELGPGHSEKTYQRAYALLLRKNNHKYEEQVLDYLVRTKLKLAILFNFTKHGVKFKRIVNINQTIGP